MGITELIIEYITGFIDKSGYISVCILMTLESMVAPVPSEAVMPFAGFLISDGRFTFTGVIFFSTLGSIIGSILSYYIGAFGGKPFIDKFGKYFLLNIHHLRMTERFFNKYGQITIFICRFIPIVRHLISIPAGAGRMNLMRFSIYTIIGAGMWNAFLTYVGYALRQNWKEVSRYSHVADIVILIIIIAAILFFIYKYFRKRMKNKR